MHETFQAISLAAKNKITTYNESKISYLMLTLLGGIFVGFGVLILVTIGGLLDPAGVPSMKIIQGVAFGVALSMVIMGGADLFTGNNLVMTIGALEKKTTWLDLTKVWTFSWGGNFLGSLLCAALFFMSGLAIGDTAQYIEKLAGIKMNATFIELVMRGILCNLLVCTAVWCAYKLKNESAKLIMIFCCIFPFVTSGFEHSVANMTLFSLALMIPHGELVSFSGMVHNLVAVSIGNAIGGSVFVGAIFWHSSVQKRTDTV
ncbi:formate/nitrite transporter family protein [Lysinibacillus sp. 54212]|uniref:formate/nitrite transporter family protein n=1 Tax=Lysinibacillus sp. 54212 TaxID=3119829 RepID=UPI002FCA7F3E